VSDAPDADDAAGQAAGAYPPPRRLAFPEDEQRLPWLAPLLDAYHIIDQGVHEAVRRQERQGRRLACAKGCSACCRSHTTIPVYPLELMGLYWYAVERLQGPPRERLAVQLKEGVAGGACPFLVDGICSVHPMRPIACRQFNVFDKVCTEGEDAYHTRRADVLTPIRRYADDAFYRMLPFYGIEEKRERRKAVKDGRLHALAKVLQDLDWTKLAERMAPADRRAAGGPEAA
jgi:Fe-S-cluster containining protein